MRLRMAKAWLGASIRSHPQLLEIGCCQRPCTWRTYSSGSNDASSLVVRTASNGVTTLRMNDPKKLNAWTMKMRSTLAKAFAREAADPSTKVMVVTGTDPYYCAGVSFADVLKVIDGRLPTPYPEASGTRVFFAESDAALATDFFF